MSVILISHHDENIYSSAKKAPVCRKKEPRYVSTFQKPLKIENQKRKRYSHATMGLPEREPTDPSQFLQKNKGVRHKVIRERPYTPHVKLRPPVIPTAALLKEDVERRNKTPPMANFVARNIKNAVHLKPKAPVERVVINCHGDSKKIAAGMEPVYIYEEGFGKVPQYLRAIIQKRERHVQFQKDVADVEQPKCRYVTKEQRAELLKGLKDNWEELQRQYQGLPIITDTIPKINRKLKLENDLKLLEKDIVLLERHPYIYVYSDNDLS
ncbi:enkurin [Photinus pyralis]|uniref:Enkurin domain-containing protein n=1 Tax=Photinus pyralis TaxID=7054 RepID=A0A1Y1KXZ6_PHOPY|nr:enkurin [Photinus pyralis]